jgi:hypothetical protein
MSSSAATAISRPFLVVAALLLAACDPEVSAVLPPLETQLAGSGYAHTVQSTSGLLAYFRFSEPSGSTAVDRIKGYRLEAEAGASLGATGAIPNDPEEGAVLIQSGAPSRLTMQLPSPFRKLSRSLGLELWLKPRGQGQSCAQPSQPLAKVLWVEGVMGAYWGVAVTGPASDALQLELLLDTDVGYESFDAVTPDATLQKAVAADCLDAPWHHVVATFDADTPDESLKIYVDGELRRSPRNPLPLRDGAIGISGLEVEPRFDIGGSGAIVDQDSGSLGEPFDGFIDELSVYSRALTPEEARTHFAAALP